MCCQSTGTIAAIRDKEQGADYVPEQICYYGQTTTIIKSRRNTTWKSLKEWPKRIKNQSVNVQFIKQLCEIVCFEVNISGPQ